MRLGHDTGKLGLITDYHEATPLARAVHHSHVVVPDNARKGLLLSERQHRLLSLRALLQ